MLFISRRVGPESFGVVDTDDDVEEVVDWGRLMHACSDCDLEIKGVSVFHESGRTAIENVEPYQPEDTVTLKQLKTAVLNHVRITVYRGSITAIHWCQNDMKSPVTIRPSDFGHSASDYCLLCSEFCNEHVITIVLDDKLEFTSRSFAVFKPFFVGIEGLGAKFDLRELSDDAKAEVIYNSIFACPNGANPLDSVIDNPVRLRRFQEAYQYRG